MVIDAADVKAKRPIPIAGPFSSKGAIFIVFAATMSPLRLEHQRKLKEVTEKKKDVLSKSLPHIICNTPVLDLCRWLEVHPKAA